MIMLIAALISVTYCNKYCMIYSDTDLDELNIIVSNKQLSNNKI